MYYATINCYKYTNLYWLNIFSIPFDPFAACQEPMVIDNCVYSGCARASWPFWGENKTNNSNSSPQGPFWRGIKSNPAWRSFFGPDQWVFGHRMQLFWAPHQGFDGFWLSSPSIKRCTGTSMLPVKSRASGLRFCANGWLNRRKSQDSKEGTPCH